MFDKYDQLTGLYSRAYIEKHIGYKLKMKNKVTVAILDIDFFTNINEKIGYENGDTVLKKIADFMKRYKNITVARYGSDEFIFAYVNESNDFIHANLSDIRKNFKKTSFVSVKPYEKVRITYSMGVAVSNENVSGTFLLLKAAEIALLKAKKTGRNKIVNADTYAMKFFKNDGVCTTVIGRNLKGSCNEGTVAFFATISEPYGVGFDINNDLLFVDRSNHQIKRIHNNRVYAVAGCGKNGYEGDGGGALKAKLCKPSGVCVHKSGRVYIADTGNHCIRMIKSGVITTVAGCGESGYVDNCIAAKAKLNRPGGVAIDDVGNIFTNDYGNNVIRKIDINQNITTIAGNGKHGYCGDGYKAAAASFNGVYGLCVDSEEDTVYIADYFNHCIRKINLRTNIIKTLCGNGKAGYSGDGDTCYSAELNGPFWVKVYKKSLYIADANNHCIRKIDLNTKIITTVIGNGQAGYVDSRDTIETARLNIPAGMAVNEKCMYIADYGNNAIRKVILDC